MQNTLAWRQRHSQRAGKNPAWNAGVSWAGLRDGTHPEAHSFKAHT